MHRPARLALAAATAVLTLAIPASASAAQQRLYVADFNNAGKVPAYQLTPAGALPAATITPDAATGVSLEGVMLTPDGDALFTGGSSGNLYGFPVTSTGALGTSVTTPTAGGVGLVVTPDGRFLYQGTGSTITGFSLAADGTVGAPVPGSPFAVTNVAAGLAVTPDGRFLYAADSSASKVHAYSIGSNGALTELTGSPFASAAVPYAISISPDGKHVYVPGRNGGGAQQVFSYDIATDGTLTQTPGSPVVMAGSVGNSFGSTVTADGKYFFTANYQSVDTSGFRINADGSLTELAGSPFALTGNPSAVTSNANGSRIYVANDTNTKVDVLSIGATGTPTPITDSPFSVGTVTGDFQSVALSPDQPPIARIGNNRTGKVVTLDARASTDPDNEITNYLYDFGDGKTLSTPSPTANHSYDPGTYTATVTETDELGCSLIYLSSGQTAFCNGGPGAKASTTFTVPKNTEPKKPTLGVKAKKKQKLGKALKLKVSSEPGVRISTGQTKVKLKGASEKFVFYKGATVTVRESGKGKLVIKAARREAKIAKGASSGKAKVKLTAAGNGGKTTRTVKIKLK